MRHLVKKNDKNECSNGRPCGIPVALATVWLVLISFVPALYGFSRPPDIKFDRVTIEQGLSESAALCVTQDAKGFVWIGTQDGLNRFDGYTMRIFRNDAENPASLSNSYISVLYTDREGTLWVGTARGLNRFDRKKENFIQYFHDPQKRQSLSSDNITAICEDRDGTLWVGNRGRRLERFESEER